MRPHKERKSLRLTKVRLVAAATYLPEDYRRLRLRCQLIAKAIYLQLRLRYQLIARAIYLAQPRYQLIATAIYLRFATVHQASAPAAARLLNCMNPA